MEIITANISIPKGAKLRRETLNGRAHLVADATLIVPGVLPGSSGPMYYPAEVINSDPTAWNGMPIVGRHPYGSDGNPVSARSPEVINTQGLGYIYQAKAEDKLISELWFDEKQLQDFDQTLEVNFRIIPRLEKGEPVALSTGLFPHAKKAEPGATFNGIPYSLVAQRLDPDHLAILPDQPAACDIVDGCGVLVNSKEDAVKADSFFSKYRLAFNKLLTLTGLKSKELVANDISHDDLRIKLDNLLCDKYDGNSSIASMYLNPNDEGSYCYIIEMYDAYFIFRRGQSYYRLGYTTDLRTSDGSVALVDEPPTAVYRDVQWRLVANKDIDPGDKHVNKNDLVQHLAVNCDCWKGDEKTLNTFTEEKLAKLKDQHDKLIAANKQIVANTEQKKEVPVAPAVPVAQPVSYQDWMKNAPPEVQSIIQNAAQIQDSQKAMLANQLTAAIADPVRKQARLAVYMKQPLAELQELVSDLPPVVNGGGQFPVTAPGELPAYYGPAAGAPSPTFNNEAYLKDQDNILPIVEVDYAAISKE